MFGDFDSAPVIKAPPVSVSTAPEPVAFNNLLDDDPFADLMGDAPKVA